MRFELKSNWVKIKKGLALSVCIGIGMLSGFAGWVYVTQYWPQSTYQALQDHEWANLNVRLLQFKTPAEFSHAEKLLYQRLDNGADRKNPLPYFFLASLFDANGQEQKALVTYHAAIAVAQKDMMSRWAHQYLVQDAQIASALIYYKQGQYAKARQWLNKANVNNSSTAGSLDDGINTTQSTEVNPDEPLQIALKNRLDYPERADNHFELAKALRHQLELPLAKREFEEALKYSHDPATRMKIQNFINTKMPARVQALSPLARYFALAGSRQEMLAPAKGNLQQAIYYYKKSISVTPDFEWAYQQLSHIYKEGGHFNNAKKYARQALAINPDFYLGYMTLGDIALAEENYQQAASQFSKAKAVLSTLNDDYHMPLQINVENQLGFTEELLENASAAKRHYENALRLAVETPNADEADKSYAQSAIERLELSLNSKKQTEV